MSDCIFCRIIAGDIPSEVVARSDEAIVIRDVNPQAPAHLLVIPLRHVEHLGEFVGAADSGQVGRLFALASRMGMEHGDAGYRVVVNEGRDGGQTVHHLHLHVLAGRPMRWPPG